MENNQNKNSTPASQSVSASLHDAGDFLQKNLPTLLAVGVLLLVIGGGVSLWSHFQGRGEEKLQAQFSTIEKDYLDKKGKFEEAEREETLKKTTPDAKKAANDPKKDEKSTAVKASGDLKADYGTVVERFNEMINKESQSKAAKMSAIYLAELHAEYKQPDQALEVLEKVSKDNKPSDMLSALVLNLKASMVADKGDCPKAVEIWQNLAAQNKMNYMHDEAKLRMGLCYEKMNDLTKAEQIYTELSKAPDNKESEAAFMDRAVTEDAKKYLRLLKVKTQKGGS